MTGARHTLENNVLARWSHGARGVERGKRTQKKRRGSLQGARQVSELCVEGGRVVGGDRLGGGGREQVSGVEGRMSSLARAKTPWHVTTHPPPALQRPSISFLPLLFNRGHCEGWL